MASSSTKSRSRTAKKRRTSKKKATTRVSYERRKEVFGLILLTLAGLLILALVTYTPADDTLARRLSWDLVLTPRGTEVGNALGVLGAFLSWLVVPNFLGYPSVVLPLLLAGWGYVTFRNRDAGILRWISGLSLLGAFVVACFAGWVTNVTETDLSLWAGNIGLVVSNVLQWALGAAGSFAVLVLGAGVLVLIGIDRDVQYTMDRVEGWFEAGWAKFTDWRAGAKDRRSERAAESAKRRETRQRERDKARAEREKAAKVKARAGKLAAPAPQPAPAKAKRPAVTPPPPADELPFPPQEPARTPMPAPKPAARTPETRPPVSPTPKPAGAPAFEVQERVEEKRANLDDRRVDAPVEDLPYTFPSVELLIDDSDEQAPLDYDQLEENKQVLEDTLATYKIEITSIKAIVGPTVTLYELTPAPGVKISRIKSLEDDLAMAMAARGIRIIAPIPGKSAVGVEIPNRNRELVRIYSSMNTERFKNSKMSLPIAIGKTIEGEVFVQDLAKMPHLLIAGATGSGKSVGINNLIVNLLYSCHPSDLKFVMIDPKKIELQQYARIYSQFIAMPETSEDPITTDFNQALYVLRSCLKEMEERYDRLSEAGVRGIKEYNQRVKQGRLKADDGHRHLPYIVVVIDELADLMMTAGKDIEAPIARLAQMARAVGIHLVVATQRPSVNVITGLIKANFPSRVAFQVASGVDSRTIMDMNGAEQLVGNGDLLYMQGSRIVRLQSPFISLDEVEDITAFIASQPGHGPYLLPAVDDDTDDGPGPSSDPSDRDALFAEAARVIVRSQQGSVSLLQRKLSVGYARAARIVDQLEGAGIVGPFEGSKARSVLVADENELEGML